MQIARAMMTAADDALDLIDQHQCEAQLRTRMRTRNERSKRQEVRRRSLKKREALIGNTIAPGVPTNAYFERVLGALPASYLGMRP
jgi:hypothetical protein